MFISDIEERKEMEIQRKRVHRGREDLTMMLSPTIMSILVRLFLTKQYHRAIMFLFVMLSNIRRNNILLIY